MDTTLALTGWKDCSLYGPETTRATRRNSGTAEAAAQMAQAGIVRDVLACLGTELGAESKDRASPGYVVLHSAARGRLHHAEHRRGDDKQYRRAAHTVRSREVGAMTCGRHAARSPKRRTRRACCRSPDSAKALWRSARARRRFVCGACRRGARPDRAQRRRQDHAAGSDRRRLLPVDGGRRCSGAERRRRCRSAASSCSTCRTDCARGKTNTSRA